MLLKRGLIAALLCIAVLLATFPGYSFGAMLTSAPTQQPIELCDQTDICRHIESSLAYGQATTSPSAGIAAVDPDLEPGFPVQGLQAAGTYSGKQSVNVTVGNIDSDPQLEILASGYGQGPLYAWNADGSIVKGWEPTPSSVYYPAYTSLAQLDPRTPELEIAVAYYDKGAYAYNGDGSILPGWPDGMTQDVGHPPAIADVDGDGIDEVFFGTSGMSLKGLKADKTALPGWPVENRLLNLGRSKPTIVDLDGDADVEVMALTGCTTRGTELVAYHHDGSTVAGFPKLLACGNDYGPVIGDVDGDGQQEIVLHVGGIYVHIYSLMGELERVLTHEDPVPSSTALALADLDGDATPEIILQTDKSVMVWRGNGSVYPGWPVMVVGEYGSQGNSSPVVGDVDGDMLPDIVVMTQHGSVDGMVHVLNRDGKYHPRFPKHIPSGLGGVPAIADIDQDGRNEIVVVGDAWTGITDHYDKVWAYDLGGCRHGAIQWGQLGGSELRQSRYPAPAATLTAGTPYVAAGKYQTWLPSMTNLRCK